MDTTAIAVILVGYLLGSIPTGYLAVRLRADKDLRQLGSGATGATNAGRVLGRGGFAVVFALDVLKGFAAVTVADGLADSDRVIAIAAAAAVAGHIWPAWLDFRGGKGLATGFGAGLALSPIVTGIALIMMVTLLPFLRPRLVPLVIAVAFAPLIATVVDPPSLPGMALIAILILVGHQTNIRTDLMRRGSRQPGRSD